jgi:hypothetical protein
MSPVMIYGLLALIGAVLTIIVLRLFLILWISDLRPVRRDDRFVLTVPSYKSSRSDIMVTTTEYIGIPKKLAKKKAKKPAPKKVKKKVSNVRQEEKKVVSNTVNVDDIF